ncbi:MAG: Ig-like domain repeat protein [Acidobacteriaceae bacterium]
MRYTVTTKLSLLALGLALGAATANAQTYTPPAVSTVSTTTVATGLTQTQAVAVDPAGDIFYSQPSIGALVEQPAGSTTPITLYTEAAGGGAYPKGVAASSTYAYISSYSGNLWQVPVGGGTAKDILGACGSLDAGYLGTITIAVDGAGNVYTSGDNETNIFKITPTGTCSIVSGATLAADNNQLVAADAAGDLAYATDNVLYSLPAGASSPTVVAATFPSITGLRSDAYGNVFVTEGSSIVEVPFINGTLDGSKLFTVAATGSANSVGVGTDGSIYTTDGSNIYRNLSGSARFAATTVGTASTAQTITAIFNTNETLTTIAATSADQTSTEITNTGAGNCATNTPYTAGSTCTITLTFKPSTIGLRSGALVLSSAAGVVGTATITGQGSGPGLTVDPGTQTSLGTTWSTPDGIAIAPSGSVFVADKSANTVSYIPAGSSTATVIATGLSSPSGLAVDGAGNVYVANTAANDIISIPFINGAYAAATTAISGLTLPSAVAIGPSGSLYIANTGAATVLRVPNQAGTLNPLDKTTLTGTFTTPGGIAIDASGNVDVSDSTTGDITQIGTTTSSIIVTGLTAPGPLAIDDSGSLYVIQAGASTILRIPFASGAYNTNGTSTLGIGFTTPTSLALDSAGNLYVADAGASTVTAIQRTTGSLNLGKVNEGDSSAEESLTLSNDGDQQLTFASPLDTATGNTTDFSLDTTSTGDCAPNGTVSSGLGCSIGVTFTPTATGTRTESLTLSSNAANASPITATLTGTGVNEPATTTTLSLVSPTGTVSYGEPITVAATVAPVTASTSTPTGTLQFYLNGVAYGNPVALSGTTASITISGLPATTNTISATYSGDTNFAGSTSKPLTVAVALAPTTTALTASINSATPVAPGTSVTLTATIASTITTVSPTGTVTFTGNGVTLGTEPVGTTGVATLTTTTLPTGTYSITATYSGDSGFATSTSNAVPVAVLAPGFQITGAPTSLTVNAPGSVATTFTVTPISGYTGGIDMACSGLPANTQCSFTPGELTFLTNSSGVISPASSQVTLTLTTSTAAPTTVAWLFPLGGLLLFGGWSIRRKLPASRIAAMSLAILAAITLLLPLSGCGNNAPPPTPSGASTVTVTLTGSPNGATTAVPINGAGNLTQTFTFTLNVQ